MPGATPTSANAQEMLAAKSGTSGTGEALPWRDEYWVHVNGRSSALFY